MAEQVARDVVKFHKKRSAVIFHCEVEDSVDIERFFVVSTNALGAVRRACTGRFLECGIT